MGGSPRLLVLSYNSHVRQLKGTGRLAADPALRSWLAVCSTCTCRGLDGYAVVQATHFWIDYLYRSRTSQQHVACVSGGGYVTK